MQNSALLGIVPRMGNELKAFVMTGILLKLLDLCLLKLAELPVKQLPLTT